MPQEIIIAVFEGEDSAYTVLADMKTLNTSDSRLIAGEGAVISVNAEGEVSVAGAHAKQRGALTGAVIGGIAGMLLGGPILGIAIGGAAGMVGSRRSARNKLKRSTGDIDFKRLSEQLTPDSSTIVVPADDWLAPTVAESLQSRGAAEVLRVSEEEIAVLLGAESDTKSESEAD